ncbi:MAG: hypothetical protein HDT23_05910 [Ruminococcus sp.]|nr:hypothetical protein [Ruminococcus sp.]
MLRRYDISFSRGNIITQHMLETMYNAPVDTIEHLLCDYSDGIISGMDIRIDNGDIIVTAGIYKLDGRLYTLENDIIFSTSKLYDSKTYVLALVLTSDGTPEINRNKKEYVTDNTIDIVCMLKTEYFSNNDRFILCEFQGRPVMPYDCNKLLKSVFNITKCRYSVIGGYTYHPFVFRLILKKLQNKTNKHPFDYVIMTEINREKVLVRETMSQYIYETFGKDYQISDLLADFIRATEKLHLKIKVSGNIEEEQAEQDINKGHPILLR